MATPPRTLTGLIALIGLFGAGGGPSLEAIRTDDVSHHLAQLAAPALEGRDTPSAGLDRAEEYIARRFQEAGLRPWRELEAPRASGEAAQQGWRAFLWGWTRSYEAPDPEGSELVLEDPDAEVSFACGRDFEPVLGFTGRAEGELCFVGFGIRSRAERFDELRGVDLAGRVAVVLEGEPESRRRFDGPEISPAASFWSKVDELSLEKASAVLLVRRPPATTGRSEPLAPPSLSFRYGWAQWQGEKNDRIPPEARRLPVLELTAEAADRLVGRDLWKLGEKIERGGKPKSFELEGRRVRLSGRTKQSDVRVDNVVGFVPGAGGSRAGEFVVVGAHHDHVGVDARGRIGLGADDNASGTAAVIEIAQALAADPPARSVIVATFAGEEDGLLGSQAFCERLPVPASSVVAMVNLDMVGRGERDEVAVLGTDKNPDLAEVIERARRSFHTGVRDVDFARRDRDDLFRRSDQYSFHQIGIPSVFLFEGLPISKNRDYHTWRDAVEAVDAEKVARTARLACATVWILASDDGRPGKPRR